MQPVRIIDIDARFDSLVWFSIKLWFAQLMAAILVGLVAALIGTVIFLGVLLLGGLAAAV